VLAFWAQFVSARSHRGPYDLLEPLALIITVAAIAAVLYPLLRLLHQRLRRDIRRCRAERSARRSRRNPEAHARALMGELCPHGWQCQITLRDGAGARDGDEPAPGRVALDWSELPGQAGRPVVMRRVWADSIPDALDAMVADRRTDEALEQIELRAALDGADWPDA
jgi:hypothetical protein